MIRYIQQAWLVLALALGFGVALAGVNSWLAPIIAVNEAQARERAAKEVVPNADAAEEMPITLADGEALKVYRVTDAGGDLVGWAVPGSGQGYADTIKLIVGVDRKAEMITGIKVLFNNETPGLGNNITRKKFRSQFTPDAHRPVGVELRAIQGGGEGADQIDAVSGATMSSQDVCDIIYKALTRKGLIEKLRAAAEAGGSPTSRPNQE